MEQGSKFTCYLKSGLADAI